MPAEVNGQTVYVPDVYCELDVSFNLAGPTAAFQVPVLLAGATEGHPYNAAASQYTHEQPLSPFVYRGNSSSVKSYFGADSDMATVFNYGKRTGLPYAFCVCMGALTRPTVIATSTGPISQQTIFAKKWGCLPGWHKISWTGGVFTVIPVKNFSLLTTTASSTATRIYVRDNSWVKEGSDYVIGANNVVNATKTVLRTGQEIDSNGQLQYYVEFTAAIGSTLTAPTQYPGIAEYSTTREESGTLADGQALYDYLNGTASAYFGAKKEASYTGALPIVIGTATAMKDIAAWGTNARGVSPAPTLSDYQALITLLDDSAWDQFKADNLNTPRLFLVADSTNTIHAAMRDWAVQKRTEGEPIAVITGCAWGDDDPAASDTTNPMVRARALDSQDIMLCAGGLDRKAACLSLAPMVWGLRAGGGVNHNLTQDTLPGITHLEVRWKERSSGHLTSLHRAGVCTYRQVLDQSGHRYVVSQGLSTLQANTQSWNEVTKDTAYVQQRDLADSFQKDMQWTLRLDQLGRDDADRDSIAACLNARAAKHIKDGTIKSYTITSISLNSSGTGYVVQQSAKFPTTTDFIVLHTTVVVGD